MCFSVHIDRNIKGLAKEFNAVIDKGRFSEVQNLTRKWPKLFKLPDTSDRVYPGTYSPIILGAKDELVITPMRYRLTPSFSQDLNYSSINPKTKRKKILPTYNARLDALEKRAAWQNIATTKHAIVPVKSFYEFVERDHKSQQIEFFSKSEHLWACALWDSWYYEKEDTTIYSFAIITDEPPKEVLDAGHDRCPIFIEKENIHEWLNWQGQDMAQMREFLLSSKAHELFNFRDVS